MAQVIQHKRRIGPGAIGGPATLAAGELAFNSNGQALYIGSDAGGTVTPLVSVDRQLEIHTASGNQNIVAGNKTWVAPALLTVPVNNLKVPGGNANEMVITDGAGNLSFAPSTSAAQQFVGSLDATAGAVTFTTASGATGPGLPAAAPANNGWYVIANVAGSTVPANVPAGTYNIGDWVISNGTAWTQLAFGGIETNMASEVGVAPAVAGGSNVQTALEGLAAADAAFVVGPAASVADNIATYSNTTGHLIKDSGILISGLATVAYVDSENTAQETAQAAIDAAQNVTIAANAAFVAAQPGVDAAQDAAIAARGDVFGPASVAADGNIAVYDLLTGKLIKDGGTTIAAIQAATGDVDGPATSVLNNFAVYADATGKLIKDGAASVASMQATQAAIDLAQDTAIATKGDVFGPAASVAANLAVFSDVTGKLIADGGQSIASIKTYVDTAIAAIPGANPPLVTAPELVGNGQPGTEITFTGITTQPAQAGAIGPTFTGNGLSTNPLVLALVDGGVF